jgi:hypothetical protein
MKWLWKMKALIYDPTVRRIGPMHSLVHLSVFRLSDNFYPLALSYQGLRCHGRKSPPIPYSLMYLGRTSVKLLPGIGNIFGQVCGS